MALSSEQKKFLNLVSYSPLEAYNLIINQKINLNSFNNGFLMDGTSLLHIVMVGYINKYDEYKDIMLYILKNSNLSLFDRKDNKKDSAFDMFLKYYDLKHNFSYDSISQDKITLDLANKYSELILNHKNKNTFQSHVNALIKLYEHQEIYNLILNNEDSFYDSVPNGIYYYDKLLFKIIIKDDLENLNKLLIKFPILKENMNKIFLSNNLQTKEYYNVLSFSVDKKSHKIFKHLINNNQTYKINLNGENNQNSFNNFKYINPIIHAIKNNEKEMIEDILESIDEKNIIDLVLEKNLLNTLNHLDKNLAISFINKTISATNSNNITIEKKHSLVKKIISSNLSFESIYNILIKTLPDDINKKISENILTNLLAKVRLENEVYNKKEVDSFINIFKLINKDLNHTKFYHDFFNEKMLKNPNIINALIVNGFNLSKIYENVFSLDKESIFTLLFKNDNLVSDISKNPEIYKESIILIYNEIIKERQLDNNFLLSSINCKSDIIFNLIKKEHILEPSFTNPLILKFLLTKNKEELDKIVSKLLDFGFNPFYEFEESKNMKDKIYVSNIFEIIFNKELNKQLIDKIFNQYNPNQITLTDVISNKMSLWYKIDIDYLDYFKEKGFNFDNQNITNYVLRFQEKHSDFLKKYFELGSPPPSVDTVCYNISNGYLKNYPVILENFPYLSREVNSSNKYPLSYLLTELNKQLKNSNNLSNADLTLIKIIDKDLSLGGLSKNKSAVKNIEKQLKSYEILSDKHPEIYKEIVSKIAYHKLSDKLSKDKPVVKKLKI